MVLHHILRTIYGQINVSKDVIKVVLKSRERFVFATTRGTSENGTYQRRRVKTLQL